MQAVFAMLIYSSNTKNAEKGTDIPMMGCLGTQFNCLLVHLLLSHAVFNISHLRYNLILQQGRAVVVPRLVPRLSTQELFLQRLD